MAAFPGEWRLEQQRQHCQQLEFATGCQADELPPLSILLAVAHWALQRQRQALVAWVQLVRHYQRVRILASKVQERVYVRSRCLVSLKAWCSAASLSARLRAFKRSVEAAELRVTVSSWRKAAQGVAARRRASGILKARLMSRALFSWRFSSTLRSELQRERSVQSLKAKVCAQRCSFSLRRWRSEVSRARRLAKNQILTRFRTIAAFRWWSGATHRAVICRRLTLIASTQLKLRLLRLAFRCWYQASAQGAAEAWSLASQHFSLHLLRDTILVWREGLHDSEVHVETHGCTRQSHLEDASRHSAQPAATTPERPAAATSPEGPTTSSGSRRQDTSGTGTDTSLDLSHVTFDATEGVGHGNVARRVTIVDTALESPPQPAHEVRQALWPSGACQGEDVDDQTQANARQPAGGPGGRTRPSHISNVADGLGAGPGTEGECSAYCAEWAAADDLSASTPVVIPSPLRRRAGGLSSGVATTPRGAAGRQSPGGGRLMLSPAGVSPCSTVGQAEDAPTDTSLASPPLFVLWESPAEWAAAATSSSDECDGDGKPSKALRKIRSSDISTPLVPRNLRFATLHDRILSRRTLTVWREQLHSRATTTWQSFAAQSLRVAAVEDAKATAARERRLIRRIFVEWQRRLQRLAKFTARCKPLLACVAFEDAWMQLRVCVASSRLKILQRNAYGIVRQCWSAWTALCAERRQMRRRRRLRSGFRNWSSAAHARHSRRVVAAQLMQIRNRRLFQAAVLTSVRTRQARSFHTRSQRGTLLAVSCSWRRVVVLRSAARLAAKRVRSKVARRTLLEWARIRRLRVIAHESSLEAERKLLRRVLRALAGAMQLIRENQKVVQSLKSRAAMRTSLAYFRMWSEIHAENRIIRSYTAGRDLNLAWVVLHSWMRLRDDARTSHNFVPHRVRVLHCERLALNYAVVLQHRRARLALAEWCQMVARSRSAQELALRAQSVHVRTALMAWRKCVYVGKIVRNASGRSALKCVQKHLLLWADCRIEAKMVRQFLSRAEPRRMGRMFLGWASMWQLSRMAAAARGHARRYRQQHALRSWAQLLAWYQTAASFRSACFSRAIRQSLELWLRFARVQQVASQCRMLVGRKRGSGYLSVWASELKKLRDQHGSVRAAQRRASESIARMVLRAWSTAVWHERLLHKHQPRLRLRCLRNTWSVWSQLMDRAKRAHRLRARTRRRMHSRFLRSWFCARDRRRKGEALFRRRFEASSERRTLVVLLRCWLGFGAQRKRARCAAARVRTEAARRRLSAWAQIQRVSGKCQIFAARTHQMWLRRVLSALVASVQSARHQYDSIQSLQRKAVARKLVEIISIWLDALAVGKAFRILESRVRPRRALVVFRAWLRLRHRARAADKFVPRADARLGRVALSAWVTVVHRQCLAVQYQAMALQRQMRAVLSVWCRLSARTFSVLRFSLLVHAELAGAALSRWATHARLTISLRQYSLRSAMMRQRQFFGWWKSLKDHENRLRLFLSRQEPQHAQKAFVAWLRFAERGRAASVLQRRTRGHLQHFTLSSWALLMQRYHVANAFDAARSNRATGRAVATWLGVVSLQRVVRDCRSTLAQMRCRRLLTGWASTSRKVHEQHCEVHALHRTAVERFMRSVWWTWKENVRQRRLARELLLRLNSQCVYKTWFAWTVVMDRHRQAHRCSTRSRRLVGIHALRSWTVLAEARRAARRSLETRIRQRALVTVFSLWFRIGFRQTSARRAVGRVRAQRRRRPLFEWVALRRLQSRASSFVSQVQGIWSRRLFRALVEAMPSLRHERQAFENLRRRAFAWRLSEHVRLWMDVVVINRISRAIASRSGSRYVLACFHAWSRIMDRKRIAQKFSTRRNPMHARSALLAWAKICRKKHLSVHHSASIQNRQIRAIVAAWVRLRSQACLALQVRSRSESHRARAALATWARHDTLARMSREYSSRAERRSVRMLYLFWVKFKDSESFVRRLLARQNLVRLRMFWLGWRKLRKRARSAFEVGSRVRRRREQGALSCWVDVMHRYGKAERYDLACQRRSVVSIVTAWKGQLKLQHTAADCRAAICQLRRHNVVGVWVGVLRRLREQHTIALTIQIAISESVSRVVLTAWRMRVGYERLATGFQQRLQTKCLCKAWAALRRCRDQARKAYDLRTHIRNTRHTRALSSWHDLYQQRLRAKLISRRSDETSDRQALTFAILSWRDAVARRSWARRATTRIMSEKARRYLNMWICNRRLRVEAHQLAKGVQSIWLRRVLRQLLDAVPAMRAERQGIQALQVKASAQRLVELFRVWAQACHVARRLRTFQTQLGSRRASVVFAAWIRFRDPVRLAEEFVLRKGTSFTRRGFSAWVKIWHRRRCALTCSALLQKRRSQCALSQWAHLRSRSCLVVQLLFRAQSEFACETLAAWVRHACLKKWVRRTSSIVKQERARTFLFLWAASAQQEKVLRNALSYLNRGRARTLFSRWLALRKRARAASAVRELGRKHQQHHVVGSWADLLARYGTADAFAASSRKRALGRTLGAWVALARRQHTNRDGLVAVGRMRRRHLLSTWAISCQRVRDMRGVAHALRAKTLDAVARAALSTWSFNVGLERRLRSSMLRLQPKLVRKALIAWSCVMNRARRARLCKMRNEHRLQRCSIRSWLSLHERRRLAQQLSGRISLNTCLAIAMCSWVELIRLKRCAQDCQAALCAAQCRRIVQDWISAQLHQRVSKTIAYRGQRRTLIVAFVSLVNLVGQLQRARARCHELDFLRLQAAFQTMSENLRLQLALKGFESNIRRRALLQRLHCAFQGFVGMILLRRALQHHVAQTRHKDMQTHLRRWVEYRTRMQVGARRAAEMRTTTQRNEIRTYMSLWTYHAMLLRTWRSCVIAQRARRVGAVLNWWYDSVARRKALRGMQQQACRRACAVHFIQWQRVCILAKRFEKPSNLTVKEIGFRYWRVASKLSRSIHRHEMACISAVLAWWREVVESQLALVSDMHRFWNLCELGNRLAATAVRRIATRLLLDWCARAGAARKRGRQYELAQVLPLRRVFHCFRRRCNVLRRVRAAVPCLEHSSQRLRNTQFYVLRHLRFLGLLEGRLMLRIRERSLHSLECWRAAVLSRRKVEAFVATLQGIPLERAWAALRRYHVHQGQFENRVSALTTRRLSVVPFRAWMAAARTSRRRRLCTMFAALREACRLSKTSRRFAAWQATTVVDRAARSHCCRRVLRVWREATDESRTTRRRLNLAASWSSRRLLLRAMGRWYLSARCGGAGASTVHIFPHVTRPTTSCAAWRPRNGRGDQLSLWSSAIRVVAACGH